MTGQGESREAETRFRVMADCAPVMLWLAEPDMRCSYFNQGWLAFTGRAMSEELGDGWTEGVHPDDLQRCLDTYVAAFNARRPFCMDYRLRRHDGEYRRIRDIGTARFDPDGGFAGYVGSAVDVQDSHESEERLKQLVADKEALLKELHHRVRNNLQILMAFVTLRRSLIAGAEARDELRQVAARIASLALIHERLSAEGTPSQIDFGGLLQDLAAAISQSEAHPEIAVTVEAVPMMLPIDRAVPLALVVNELVTHCYRHAFPGGCRGTIHLALAAGPGPAVLTVADDGIGVPVAAGGTDGFGNRLIDMLARQAGVDVVTAPGAGSGVTVVLVGTGVVASSSSG